MFMHHSCGKLITWGWTKCQRGQGVKWICTLILLFGQLHLGKWIPLRHQFYLQITSQIYPFLSLLFPFLIQGTSLPFIWQKLWLVFTFIFQFVLPGEARVVFSKLKSEENINQITATLLKPPIFPWHLDYIQTCYPFLWSPLSAGPYLPFKSHRRLSSFAPKVFCHMTFLLTRSNSIPLSFASAVPSAQN